MTELTEGTIVAGRYRVLCQLGKGAMGGVYRAEQLDPTGEALREVAIKTILPQHVENEQFAKRFLREVRVAMGIRSPHVVTVYDAGETDDGALFYSMDLVEGGTLQQLLRRDGALALGRAARLVAQIADALSVAHRPPNPVVHRDLKPANIFIEHRDGEEWIQVADFGIAKVIGTETTGLTQAGQSIGTPRYMAPEQWRGGNDIDGRADLYSLGVIFHELLTGEPPFKGDLPQLLHQHLNEPAPPLPDSMPQPVAEVVRRLLAKSPTDRFESAGAFKQALRAALEGGPPMADPLAAAATEGFGSASTVIEPPPRPAAPEAAPEAAPAPSAPSDASAGPALGTAPARESSGALKSPFAIAAFLAIPAAIAALGLYQATLDEDVDWGPRPAPTVAPLRGIGPAPALESGAKITASATENMVRVPGGSYWIGCNDKVDPDCEDDEKPGRRVQVQPFWIGLNEVTVANYRRCVQSGSCSDENLDLTSNPKTDSAEWCNWPRQLHDHPINCVDWTQAQSFCAWAGARLPTETEWEAAARGTDGRRYPWGNEAYGTLGPVANVADETARQRYNHWRVAEGYDDGYIQTSPVGTFFDGNSPSGAMDMIGNVWEWTASRFGDVYVIRGCSAGSVPEHCRVSVRQSNSPAHRTNFLGFRCVKDETTP